MVREHMASARIRCGAWWTELISSRFAPTRSERGARIQLSGLAKRKGRLGAAPSFSTVPTKTTLATRLGP